MITLYSHVLQILDCLRVLHNVLSFAPLFKWIMALCSAFCTLSKPFAHCLFYGECFTQMNIVHSTIRSLSNLLKIVEVLQIVSFIQLNVSSDFEKCLKLLILDILSKWDARCSKAFEKRCMS